MMEQLINDSRVTVLSQQQEFGRITATELWTKQDDLKHCPAVWQRGRLAGKRCPSRSGRGSVYEGLGGPCMAHGGMKKAGRATGAWLMAHMYAQEYDVSPWEALLLVIRITAGKLRYIETVLASATSDDELEGRVHEGEPTGVTEGGDLTTGRNLSWWVDQSQLERGVLAKVSKAAIDAGVAQLLIERELRGGEERAGEYIKVLEEMEAAGMDDASLEIARGVLRSQLQLALES